MTFSIAFDQSYLSTLNTDLVANVLGVEELLLHLWVDETLAHGNDDILEHRCLLVLPGSHPPHQLRRGGGLCDQLYCLSGHL